MNLKAIIFDLDATLITTDDVSYQAIRSYLQEKHAHEIEPQHYGHTIGHSNEDFIRVLQEKTGLAVNGSEMIPEIRARADYAQMKLKPGARELLDFLHHHKLKIALATTTSRARFEAKTGHLDIARYFDVVVTGDDVTKLKPDPELYLTALKKLDLTTKQCVIVEDNESGVQAGQAAGCTVLFVPNSYAADADETTAKYQVERFHTLADIITYLRPQLPNSKF